MFNRILFLLLGICLVLYGLFVIIQRGYYSSKFEFYFDFGPYHYIFGIIVTIIGILLVYTSLRKKTKDFEEKFVICPKCKTPFNQKDVPKGQCPKCDVELEDLEEFYERDTELKVRNNKPGS